MGDPKKARKKYKGPRHPWEKARIDSEQVLLREYGLKNKKEIWRVNSLLKRFKDQAKRCATARTSQLELEKSQLLKRLQALGLLQPDSTLDDVLGLGVEHLLNRRLQTLVCRQKLATTMSQARQFIVHGHVIVDSRKITVPGHIVGVREEHRISLVPGLSVAEEKDVREEA